MEISITLPSRLREAVVRELAPDEHIVWMRQPAARLLTRRTVVTAMIGLACTTFASLFLYAILHRDESHVVLHFLGYSCSLPFIVIGLFAMYSPVWSFRTAKRCVYLITNYRAISFDYNGIYTTIRTFTPEKLQDVSRKQYKNGFGDIAIGFRGWMGMDADNHRAKLGFLDIPDAEHAEALLRELASRAQVS